MFCKVIALSSFLNLKSFKASLFHHKINNFSLYQLKFITFNVFFLKQSSSMILLIIYCLSIRFCKHCHIKQKIKSHCTKKQCKCCKSFHFCLQCFIYSFRQFQIRFHMYLFLIFSSKQHCYKANNAF